MFLLEPIICHSTQQPVNTQQINIHDKWKRVIHSCPPTTGWVNLHVRNDSVRTHFGATTQRPRRHFRLHLPFLQPALTLPRRPACLTILPSLPLLFNLLLFSSLFICSLFICLVHSASLTTEAEAEGLDGLVMRYAHAMQFYFL